MNLFILFSFPLFHTGNKPMDLSHFNMLLILSVQKHFRLFVLSTSFLSHVFSRPGSLQDNFKNNLFHIAAILYTGAVLNLSCFLLVPHCYSDRVSVFLQVFGLPVGQQELDSLQCGWADGVGVHSKTARGISEQTPHSHGHFRFAGDWSKIILLAFYFYVPVLLLLLFLNNSCSGFTI